MNGQEKVGVTVARDLGAGGERQVDVGGAGEDDVGAGRKQALEPAGQVEREILLQQAVGAVRVVGGRAANGGGASVSGIDDDGSIGHGDSPVDKLARESLRAVRVFQPRRRRDTEQTVSLGFSLSVSVSLW